MQAWEVGDYASSGRLRLVQRPDPVPGSGEALIRVRATGPNARDYAIWTTGMGQGPAAPTFIPLCDVAGDVLAVGTGVQSVAAGQRVTMIHYARWLEGPWEESMRVEDYANTRDGFLRELAVVPASALVPLPDSISYEAAATLPSAGLTAWQAVVEEGRLRPGDTVVTLGTGGVSVYAMQWARLLGARVIVTSSSDEKLTRIRELGLIDQLADLLPERIGSPLSINALREDLGVAFDTARGWLETLERLYYLFEIRPYAGKLARTLRREAKIYLFDYSLIESPGARFENVVALHLRKLVDHWNDRGEGDYALWYVRDKERREVDFLVTESRKPWMLVETKLADGPVSPALRYYREQFKVPHAIQLVRCGRAPYLVEGIAVMPAAPVLALI